MIFAQNFILSRDVPISNRFPPGSQKLLVGASVIALMVAAVAELSLPIVGCKIL